MGMCGVVLKLVNIIQHSEKVSREQVYKTLLKYKNTKKHYSLVEEMNIKRKKPTVFRFFSDIQIFLHYCFWKPFKTIDVIYSMKENFGYNFILSDNINMVFGADINPLCVEQTFLPIQISLSKISNDIITAYNFC